jgi:hypothetical protein
MSKQFTAKSPKKLPENARKIIDYMRRHLAENFAAATGRPLDQALTAIAELHEAGHLALIEKDGRVELVPCFKDGTVLEGSFDFETSHRNAGGRS